MKASDVMTRNVLTVGRETSVAQAIRMMLDNHVSGLPVLGDGKVVGILTEGDLLRRSETGTEKHRPRWLEILMGPGRMAGEYVRTHGRKVAEILTTDSGATADNHPRAIAHAVSSIISRPEALRRTNARRRAEQFTWPRAAAGMLGALGAV